jgi:glycolate oxidase iron-sulfur subunit
MQHNIPVQSLGPQGEAMAHAVERCVHCGFCLPVCPTYQVLGEEMDSPRGRIFLMKEVLEGNLTQEEALPYIDRCLGCEACIPACPSGVPYQELLTPFRALTETKRKHDLTERLSRLMVLQTLPFPWTFRLAATFGRLAKPVSGLLPEKFGSMLRLLPADIPAAQPLPELVPAKGTRRGRVAFLAGCVQQVLAPEINWATLRVLAENGIETIIPKHQNCCGALSMHTGAASQALALARHNIDIFPQDVDAVLTNAAGCGSGMKEYGLLFSGLPEEQAARAFAQRVKDVTVFLDELGLKQPPALPQPLKVAYHDACHLAHAQGVRAAPRRLLASIPNLTLLEIPNGDTCCGSAGTYNLEQPAIAHELGQRKARNILTTEAEAIATGNIGCITQIRSHLTNPLPVYHTMEVLDRAYGDTPPA